jgi:hypothetical protein
MGMHLRDRLRIPGKIKVTTNYRVTISIAGVRFTILWIRITIFIVRVSIIAARVRIVKVSVL